MLPHRVILLERGKIRPERSGRSLPANPAVTMRKEHDSNGADLQQLHVYTAAGAHRHCHSPTNSFPSAAMASGQPWKLGHPNKILY